MALDFELVSPERLVMSGEAEIVTVPGSEGDFGVLEGHAPFLSTLRPGILTVRGKGGAETRVFVRGGFAEAGPTGLTVLAEQALPVEEIDKAAMEAEIRNAEEDVADAKDDDARQRAEFRLSQLKEVVAALSAAGRS